MLFALTQCLCMHDAGWLGLGPAVFFLVLLHIAALLFWVIALIRTSGSKTRKTVKQH